MTFVPHESKEILRLIWVVLFTAFPCPLRNITVLIYWPSSTELAPRPRVEGWGWGGKDRRGGLGGSALSCLFPKFSLCSGKFINLSIWQYLEIYHCHPELFDRWTSGTPAFSKVKLKILVCCLTGLFKNSEQCLPVKFSLVLMGHSKASFPIDREGHISPSRASEFSNQGLAMKSTGEEMRFNLSSCGRHRD